jgi:hypothetical protein
MQTRAFLALSLTAVTTLVAVGACNRWEPPASRQRQPPTLACSETAYDFGQAAQGGILRHSYTIRNTGELNLRIDNVRTSCDCTASISAGVLTPGASATVEVSFDTARAFGPARKSITLYSNDPTQPVTTLTLSADVIAAVAADPPQLYVGRIGRGQAVAKAIRLLGREAGAVVSVDTDGKVVDATLRLMPQVADKSIRIAIKQDAPLGEFAESLAVRGPNRQAPILIIPVSGIVEGDLVVSPSRLEFAVPSSGHSAAQSLAVNNRGRRPAQVLAATISPPVGDAQVRAVQAGKEYRVVIALQDVAPAARRNAKPLEGTLQLKTDHPEQPLITVPFSAHITEKR